ncbi:MAG: FixH family protein, partial [Planctomycetaceae bacterium]
ESKGFITTVQRQGEHVTLTLDAATPEGAFLNDAESTLTLIDPRLGDRKLPLAQVAPGRYAAQFDVTDPGAYHLELSQTHQGQTLYRQSRGLVVGYPDELRLRPTNEELLRRIAETSDGRYNLAPAEVFSPPDRSAVRHEPLWPYLVMTALALWVLDVALRRIDFSLLLPRRVNAT